MLWHCSGNPETNLKSQPKFGQADLDQALLEAISWSTKNETHGFFRSHKNLKNHHLQNVKFATCQASLLERFQPLATGQVPARAPRWLSFTWCHRIASHLIHFLRYDFTMKCLWSHWNYGYVRCILSHVKNWKALKFSCWSWAFMKLFAIGHVVNGWNLSWLQLWTKHGCEHSWVEYDQLQLFDWWSFCFTFVFFRRMLLFLIPITTGHEDPQILRTSCRCLGWWNPDQAWWLFSILVRSLDSLGYIIWDVKVHSPVGGKTTELCSFLGPCQWFF